MSKPSSEQVQQEIAALKEIKPKVRRYTFFGDDNHAAIDAQIVVLEEDYDEDAIYGEWEDDEHVLSSALEALAWKEGDLSRDNQDGALVDEWRSLAAG